MKSRTHGARWPRRSAFGLPMRLIVLAATIVTAACHGGGSAKAGADPDPRVAGRASTTLYGYVFKLSGSKKQPAARATVWTDPPSDQVFTDSTGYWEIRDGVVDSRYRILAKADGVTGKSAMLDVKPGSSVQAEVQIGLEETPWPPTLSVDDKGVAIRKGPKGIRCCGE
jgi:hypothetical protein